VVTGSNAAPPLPLGEELAEAEALAVSNEVADEVVPVPLAPS